MINLTLADVLNTVLSIKVGYLLLGILALILLGFAIYGIVQVIQKIKARNTLKFAPLALLGSGISIKLIIYVLAFAMIGATSYGLYRKITEKTSSTNYRNEVSRCQTVTIDQRQITPEKKYLIRLELFGLDVHFVDLTPKTVTTIDNNKVIVTPIPEPPIPEPKKNSLIPIMVGGIGGLILGTGIYFLIRLLKPKVK